MYGHYPDSRKSLRIALPVCNSSNKERIGRRRSRAADLSYIDPTSISNPRPIEDQMLVVYHTAPELPDGSSAPHKTSRSRIPTKYARFTGRGFQPLEYLGRARGS